jgi:hypothetical protein
VGEIERWKGRWREGDNQEGREGGGVLDGERVVKRRAGREVVC